MIDGGDVDATRATSAWRGDDLAAADTEGDVTIGSQVVENQGPKRRICVAGMGVANADQIVPVHDGSSVTAVVFPIDVGHEVVTVVGPGQAGKLGASRLSGEANLGRSPTEGLEWRQPLGHNRWRWSRRTAPRNARSKAGIERAINEVIADPPTALRGGQLIPNSRAADVAAVVLTGNDDIGLVAQVAVDLVAGVRTGVDRGVGSASAGVDRGGTGWTDSDESDASHRYREQHHCQD